MKIDGYRCRLCQNNQFMGKSGKWVCSQCFTPVPLSLVTYMEFDQNKPIIRVSSQERKAQRIR
jgi:hypothetical protein